MALPSTINHISLCAGCGGLDFGLKLALGDRLRTVCYVEREAYAAACIMARMADAGLDQAPIWDELETFDGAAWHGCVDIISAGYPCQPFSVAGRRRGTADERHVWPEVARIIGETRPPWVFLENVPGHLVLGYAEVRAELQGLGYAAVEGLFTASEVGASHRRKRLFVLAHAEDADGRGGEAEQPQKAGSRGRGPGSRDAEMADASSTRGQQVPTSAPCDEATHEGRSTQHSHKPSGGGEGMADAERARWQERAGVRCDDGEKCEAAERSGLPIFPPGPGELDAWRRVLEADQTLEPAICRVADGTAHRVDRLRLCGNGVVPLQAAYAFCTLFARLQVARTKEK